MPDDVDPGEEVSSLSRGPVFDHALTAFTPLPENCAMPRLDFYRSSDAKPILSVRLDLADLLIGRAPECTVQLPGSKLSRHHLRIRASDGGHLLLDLSRNGTRINAAWVRGEVRLEPGDRVYLGDRVFIYQPDDAPVAELRAEPTLVDSQIPG